MNKEFIPYEQALELKELGFREKCMAIYFTPTKELLVGKEVNEFTTEVRIYAPLYQQAFRWFREKHDLFALVHRMEYLEEYYYMWVIEGGDWRSDYETYEEAELACLKKLIEIAKNK